jgi:hypothetical protein
LTLFFGHNSSSKSSLLAGLLGPLRTEPERVYYFTGESVAEVGRRGENTFKLLAALQYQGRKTNSTNA